MTSSDQLRPGRTAPDGPGAMRLRLRQIPSDEPLLRATQFRVGAPYHWSSCYWSDEDWEIFLSTPRLSHWLIVGGDGAGDPAGILTARAHPPGQVEIDTFGLVPEYVGRGLGAPALTLAVRAAWALPPVGAESVRRVWLHTSSLDHPAALGNYERRGFRAFRSEPGAREVP